MQVLSVRQQMADASKRIGRLRRIDRAAVAVITLGGIGVVAAVLGILVFVVSEAIPLFRAAGIEPAGRVPVATGITTAAADRLRAIGVDEYQRYLYTVEPSGMVAFHRLDTGARGLESALAGLDGAAVTSSARGSNAHHLAVGLSDGRVLFRQVRYQPVYENQTLRDVTIEVADTGTLALDPQRRGIERLAYLEQDGQRFVAGVVGEREIHYSWTTGEGAEPQRATLSAGGEAVTQVRVGRNGTLLAGTATGRVYHWELQEAPVLTDVSPVSTQPVTAVEWMLGGNSYVAAAADGTLTGWLRVTLEDGRAPMMQAHTFDPQGAAVRALALSSRERSFATAADDGTIVLRHQTSERTLARLASPGAVLALVITPKADGLLVLTPGELHRFTLTNPHPEISFHTLFGKVWYEGYDAPAYVWQSTGATDDIEPKFSLVPLVFGTIKGTLYAMLFAVPLAVLAALYTSQFTDPVLRARIKPTVEIMAALPSVVIGFLAGLYLASAVERHLVGVLLMIPVVPLCGTAGVLLWRRLPTRVAGRFRAGGELVLILPLLLAGAWLSLQLAPFAERTLFASDARQWLQNTLGMTYDQRNCLVVGIAMGFAVIPIIFTIAEDAFSSVPASLTAASLALGASRWQTAIRVVLPTASPGIFSAVMVGFGRAVGETMIVLMATGNTPVMDWSIFNGIRTLSANIAVEIPEAPQGGTLYRTLFLAAAMLFAMTFVVNTLAEIIRQRLRDRYKAI